MNVPPPQAESLDSINTAPDDTLLLNVAVIPPAEIASEIAILSGRLRAAGGIFEIDGNSRHAHLTLYMARFGVASVPAVRERLTEALVDSAGIRLRHSGYFVTPGGYFEASYERSTEVMALHRTAIGLIRDLRHAPGRPIIESYFGVYDQGQRENAEQSGYDLVDDLYRPHITITRFASPPDAAAMPRAARDLSFAAARIGLFVADAQGAARELVTEFELTS